LLENSKLWDVKKFLERAEVLMENDNKDLKLGTLRQIISQLGLDWEQFKDL
jgi:hypothetical protein